MKTSLQLYSIRDFTERDFKGSLKKVAEMGYTGVEFAGYCGLEAEELKAMLDEFNLEAVSSHVSLNALRENLSAEINYLAAIGSKHIVCPWAPIYSRENALEYSEIFSVAALECRENGLTLSYHNHDHEFKEENGELLIDTLIKNAPLLMLEPDVFWIQHAGIEPIDFLKNHIERCSLVHLKQMKDVQSKENVTADAGIIDFKEISNISADIPMIYEQEEYHEMTSMQAAEISAKYLLGL